MNCCRCGKGISDNVTMFPIDPKGTPGRRWECTTCFTLEGRVADQGIRDIVCAVDPSAEVAFKKRPTPHKEA